MKIHLHQIPAGGAHFEGEEPCPISDLEKEDVACAGPLRYSIDVGVNGSSLWASGSLHQPVQLRCVACLESFDYVVEVPNFAVHTELHGPETVDLTPFAREDIVLNLPAYPHCHREGKRECKAASVTHDDAEDAKRAREKREADWGELDKLKL